MKHFATFDDAGIPTAFFLDDINGEENIPAGAVEISEAQWREFIDNAGRRRWDNGQVVPYEPPPAPEVVPSLTRTQIRLWLAVTRAIPLANVDAAIAQLPEPDRAIAEIKWADGQTFLRSDPLIDAVGALLGLTPAEIDAGFGEAPDLWP